MHKLILTCKEIEFILASYLLYLNTKVYLTDHSYICSMTFNKLLWQLSLELNKSILLHLFLLHNYNDFPLKMLLKL